VFTRRPLRSDPRFTTENLKLSRPAAAASFAERLGESAGVVSLDVPDRA
jgi:hypothetical protein